MSLFSWPQKGSEAAESAAGSMRSPMKMLTLLALMGGEGDPATCVGGTTNLSAGFSVGRDPLAAFSVARDPPAAFSFATNTPAALFGQTNRFCNSGVFPVLPKGFSPCFGSVFQGAIYHEIAFC